MNKYVKSCSIAATGIILSLFAFTPAVHASELSQKIEQDCAEVKGIIDTHKAHVKQNLDNVDSKLDQKHEALTKLKTDINTTHNNIEARQQRIEQKVDTIKKDVNDIHSTLKEHHYTVHQQADALKKDINDIKTTKATIKNDIHTKVTEKKQQLENIRKNKDIITVDTQHLPNVNINLNWFDEEKRKIADDLFKKFERKVITDLQYEQKLIEILNDQLKAYIRLHENHFKFSDLLKAGFDVSQLSPKNHALLNNLQALHKLHKLNDHQFNTQALDILKNDLKQKGDLLENFNNKLAANNNRSDIGSNLADNFADNMNSEPYQSTPIHHNSKSTSALPESGESQNKPLIIAGVIVLIIGLLILLRSRKNKK